MIGTAQLIETLKKLVKARGLTYADVAARVGLSEASVKRLFSRGSFTLARLQQFRNAGKTIVLVTHSMQQVLEYCHRAILLSKGRVMADGHPEEVTELYRASIGLQVPELVDATRRR